MQLLLGHMKLESTVRYLGGAVDDVLEMADPTQRLDHQEPHRQSRYGRKYGGRLPGAFGTPDASVSGLGRRQCWVDHNGQHDGRWPCHDQTLRRGVEKDLQRDKFKRGEGIGQSGDAQFWLQINHPGR